MNWQTVIGLEVHVQLATRSKLFSSAAVDFGATPNSRTALLDLGMPGTLPVVNREAIRMAVLFGCAVGASINKKPAFTRKNYFYPDLPKGYQLSQLDEPILLGGNIPIPLTDGNTKNIAIHHAHLEEDAGKSLHDRFDEVSAIDLNRAGTPLLEVVSQPEMNSAEEAVAYLKHIHKLVCALNICDGDMSQGSMRCDVNISLRPTDTAPLGVRSEIKNVNSFRFVERAIAFEIARHQALLEQDMVPQRETRLYDERKDETRAMRSKEQDEDYRYFPEPDLLPLTLSEEYIAEIRSTLPELPQERCQRLVNEYGLKTKEANIIATDDDTTAYFEELVKLTDDAVRSVNWMLGELTAILKRRSATFANCPITPPTLAHLINKIIAGTISNTHAKTLLKLLCDEDNPTPARADAIITAEKLELTATDDKLADTIATLLKEHPEQVAQYRAADAKKQKKLLGFFVGQSMQRSQGNADPAELNRMLKEALDGLD